MIGAKNVMLAIFLFCFTAADESKSDIFEIVSCNDENKDGLQTMTRHSVEKT